MRRQKTELSEHFLAEWSSRRKRGKRHFVLYHGVMLWGGFMLFFSLGVFHYAHYGSMFSMEGLWWMRWLVGALIWSYVGFLYGRSQWSRNEQLFKQYQSVNASEKHFDA